MSYKSSDIAIVGMGGRFPGSPDLPAFWRTVRDRHIWTGAVPKSRWDHNLFYSPTGARDANKTYANKIAIIDRVEQFAPDFFGITPRRAKVMDPQQRLFLDVVRMALEDGGYATRPFPRDKTGVFVGATVSDFMDILITRMKATLLAGGEFGAGLSPVEDAWKALTKDLAPLQAYSLVGTLMNMVAANVNQCFDFGGAAFTMDAACSSALVALNEAVVHLRAGLCDAAVVGGVYLILAPDNIVAFSRIGAISPSDACLPFDRRADGFVIGEGLGAVLLRRLPEALAAGDHIYAVIRGIGMNNDGKAEGPMTPRKEGQIAVLERAYADADVSPLTVDFIEAHGTATPVGDATEVAALGTFRGRPGERPCALSSIKANIGHSMSAAGMAGLMRAALSVDRRVITPHAGYQQVRDELELGARGFVIPDAVSPWAAPADHPRRAGVNSFGFGGTNVHVVLEEAPSAGERVDARVQVPASYRGERTAEAVDLPELFIVSAPTEALLRSHAADLRQALVDSEDVPGFDLGNIALSLSLRRVEPVRAAFVASTRDELLGKLGALAAGEDGTGLYLSKGAVKEHEELVAFLFPGQGAQAPGLARDLYERFPVFRRALDELAGALARGRRPLLSYLYPDNSARETAMAELTRTEICQPIMAALGLALARLCRAVGVNPLVVTGHSLGEFAAAACAGVFTERDAIDLVAERGRLIAELPLADRGTMAAVAGDRAQVLKYLAGLPDVAVANVNHPTQTVISGTKAGVERALRDIEKAGLKTRRLPVSHAFHSPLMAGLRPSFEALLENTPVKPSGVPVVSAVAPALYPDDPAAVRQLLADHATSSVDFVGALRVVAEQGARVFLQMGGGSALVTMARLTLAQTVPDGQYLTAAGDKADDGRTFLETLAALFARGEALRLSPLFEERALRPVTLPATPLETRALWPLKREEAHAALPIGGSSDKVPSMAKDPGPSPTNSSADGSASAESPAAAQLAALFQQQMALLDAQVAIMRQQNALLAGNGVAVPAALPQLALPNAAAPTPVAVTAPPATAVAPARPASRPANGGAEIQARILEVVARITASPTDKLSANTRLGGDLGFDSLMVVELTSGLSEIYPGVELPRSLFASDVSVGELARHIASLLGKTTTTSAVSAEMRRHVVALKPQPLPATPAHTVIGEVVLLADEATRAFAGNVRTLLAARSIDVRVANEADALQAAKGGPLHLVDLRGQACGVAPAQLSNGPAEALRAPLLRALATARGLDACRPASFLLVHSGGHALGLEGFAKALAHEWDVSTVRSIQLPAALPVDKQAQIVADELLSADSAPETRYELRGSNGSSTARRLVPVLQVQPLAEAGKMLPPLPSGVVAVVTGGARGLGAKLARTLARNFKARVAILGRAHGGPEVEALLAQIRASGGQALYFACDVRDCDAVAAAITRAREQLGPIQIAIHAAGVVDDAQVARKSDDSAARVFDTKVAGALHLWRALAADPLRNFLSLGSLSGRFGNAHQTDYAAANNTLARLCEAFAAERPDVASTVVDLPPWQGSGMVSALPEAARKQLATRVRFLTDDEGLPLLLGQLQVAASGEIVLGAGLDGVAAVAVALHQPVDVQHLPYLGDHVVAGRPVLPLAGAVDLMLRARAQLLGGQTTPVVLEDVTVIEGVVLEGERASVRVEARQQGDAFTAHIQRTDGRVRPAFRARMRAGAASLLPLPTAMDGAATLGLDEFYASHTFHGPGLRALTAVEALGDEGVRGSLVALAVDGGSPLISALDGVLQLFAYWSVSRNGRGGLPLSAETIEITRVPAAGEALTCVARLSTAGEGGRTLSGDADVLDANGTAVLRLRGLEAELRSIGLAAATTAVTVTSASKNGHGDTTPALELPAEKVRPEEFPEVKELEQRLKMAEVMGIRNPYFRSHEGVNAATAVVKGRTLVNYSSYNYLGLSGHPQINEAVKRAVDRFGSSVSASRVASGERPLHHELEETLAGFLGCEDAIVMVGGHATNVSVIGHVLGPEDLVVHDSLAHDSILGGARLSGARRRPFAHNDPDALERILRETRSGVRRVLIAVEGVYSMDGDIAPLDRIIALKKKYGAMLLVDEAHSVGVLGHGGRGIGEYYDVVRADVDMWMGTLSKSFASCGGYIAGSRRLVQFLRYTVPGFVYSVGISPANAAAALEAVRLIEAHPELPRELAEKSRLFLHLCRERNIDTGMSRDSAVIPCIVRNSYACLQLSQALEVRGINVQPILYPAVEENQARLRFFISVTHSEAQLRETADILAEELFKLVPRPQGKQLGAGLEEQASTS